MTQHFKKNNMKKTVLILAIFASLSSVAQPPDSVKVTLSLQVRDIEYISAHYYQSYGFEELLDSIKLKMRVNNPPTGNTPVSITGYIQDWLFVYSDIATNVVAVASNCKSRFENLLLALNNTLINSKVQAVNDYQALQFTEARKSGRNRLRRQRNND